MIIGKEKYPNPNIQFISQMRFKIDVNAVGFKKKMFNEFKSLIFHSRSHDT